MQFLSGHDPELSGVTEYFDPPENPGLGPNFTEKMGPLTQKASYFLLKY